MKRIFTLVALMALTLAVSAQGYRKWDFANWSPQTVANLMAESEQGGQLNGSWSDIEKKDAGATTPGGGVCFWSYGDNVSEDGYLMANGSVIAETEGLVWNTAYTTRRSLALAVNYPTALADYAGPQYLWLGGGNAKSASARIYCFIIPKVQVGQKITMTVESHKPSDARGVALYAGNCTDDALLIGEAFKPTTQATYTWEEGWTLPEGATPNDDGTIDIQVYNTNGCHIYSIEVGNSDQKSKVGYLYGGSLDDDQAYQKVKDNEKYTIEPVEATGALTMEQLTQYDAIILSSTVENAEAIASLKAIQPFVPTLNLNPAIYTAWGYGTTATAEGQFVDVKNPAHALFRGLEIIEEEGFHGLLISEAEQFQTVSLSETSPFASDLVLATALGTDAVAIHAHSLDRNGYLYLPYDQTVASLGNADLLANAISVVANTKAKVAQAPAPGISLEYKDMRTIVSLKSTVRGAQVFYTLDGSTPTEQSTRYEEPFTISQEGVTVKAVALGEGYLLSEVAEQLVDLRHQAAAPAIAIEQQEGKTIVTLSSEMEGATIYYNFDGNQKASNSSKYEAPIELTHARTIYAFVEAEGLVTSELTSQQVSVLGEQVRIDILAHMDANSAEYNGGSTSTAYYFSWGKNKSGDSAYPYYDPESRSETVGEDPETGDEVITVTYGALNPEEVKDFENGWMLRARGQIVDWENLSGTGTGIGDTSGYNYASVADVNPDFPATKGAIVLADKNTVPSDGPAFPYNAYIVTTQKYAGPFDIVINAVSVTKPDAAAKHQVVLETSTDGNVWESNWQTVGDTIEIVESARLTHNITRSYEGSDEVYVRAYLCGNNSKVGFYDIYIANQGEKSQERMGGTGISDARNSVKSATVGIYSLNGTRLSTLRRGFNIVRHSDGSTKKVLVK